MKYLLAFLSFFTVPFIQSMESIIPLQVTIPLTDLKKAAIAHQLTPYTVFGWEKWKQVPLEVTKTLCIQQIDDYIKRANPNFTADQSAQKNPQQILAAIVQKKLEECGIPHVISKLSQNQTEDLLAHMYSMKSLLNTIHPEIFSIIKERVGLPFFLKKYILLFCEEAKCSKNISHMKIYKDNYWFINSKNSKELKITNLKSIPTGIVDNIPINSLPITFKAQINKIDLYEKEFYLHLSDDLGAITSIYNIDSLLNITASQVGCSFSSQAAFNNVRWDFFCSHHHYIGAITQQNDGNPIFFRNQLNNANFLYYPTCKLDNLVATTNYFVAKSQDALHIFKEDCTSPCDIQYPKNGITHMTHYHDQLVTAHTFTRDQDILEHSIMFSKINDKCNALISIQNFFLNKPISFVKNITLNHDTQAILAKGGNTFYFITPNDIQGFKIGLPEGAVEQFEIANNALGFVSNSNNAYIIPLPLAFSDAWKHITLEQLMAIKLYTYLRGYKDYSC